MDRDTQREVEAWTKKACDDLRGAEVDLAAEPPLVEDALFHCQPAAEKSMKAFLTAHGVRFPKTHDLDQLAIACEAIDPSLRDVLTPARDLTVFAWEFRYPGGGDPPPESEAGDCLGLARRVVCTIQSRLEAQAPR